MATLDQLERALVKADAVGDADAARAFAAEIKRMRAEAPAQKQSMGEAFKDQLVTSMPGRVLRGAKDVIDTGAELLATGYDKLTGGDSPTVSSIVTGQPQGEAARVRAMNEAGERDYQAARERVGQDGVDLARVGGQVLATAPVGGVLGAGVKAAGATRLGTAIATGGLRTGAPAAATLGGKAADMGIRMLGGGITGGAAAGLIDPESAGTGAVIGAALPPALKVAGAAGRAVGRAVSGPEVPAAVRESVEAARSAGYVIPPSQAKPSLVNRALEGFAGKITTAQNASARNQPITNELARRAIGAADLTPESIAAVRSAANASYDDLARFGAFEADDAYRNALQKAAGSKALPGIANKEVDDLVEALSSQGKLDAQQTIESIKRLRFEGSANKGAQDPVKKALGGAQMRVANALEELIDRNLQKAGQPELLSNYRAARQTLAKVYDVEKALNASSGNVDANKLARLLDKGRPLTGELRQVAEFAQRFPKAARPVEGMGSLPQSSPLDWTAATGLSLATSNPLMMASVLARPAARAAVLSGPVQNRLMSAPASSNALADLLANPELQQAVLRSAPVLGANR